MSDYRAIAGVSATLQNILKDRMELSLEFFQDMPPISVGAPTNEASVQEDAPRLNIFIYQIQENVHLQNYDLPGLSTPLAYGKPPLSLNLNVMLTAYGSTSEDVRNETKAQRLLGSAMRVLHDNPIITPQMRTASDERILDESLIGATETIKINLDPISLEDLTKVWTALTLPYRLSVAYTVSVIQIESQATRTYPQLVGESPDSGPNIKVIPLARPTVERIAVLRSGDPPQIERTFPYARIGDKLIIYGQNFSRVIELDVNGLILPVRPISGTRIELEIPDDPRLQPGGQPVEVLSAQETSDAFRLHSNCAFFVLVPRITGITSELGSITIHGQRLYHPDGDMQTLIDNLLFTNDAYKKPLNPEATSEITLATDLLPNRSINCFVSQPIQLPDNNVDSRVEVKIGAVALEIDLIGSDISLKDTADKLEQALRKVSANQLNSDKLPFEKARVTALNDHQLVIIPGDLQSDIDITQVDDNSNDNSNEMTNALSNGEMKRGGYLSGTISPFPILSSQKPMIGVKRGDQGSIEKVELNQIPQSLDEAATILQDVIPNTEIAVVDNQLLILTQDNQPIDFSTTEDDETTVSELRLRHEYTLRVRVNGAETLTGHSLVLPVEPPTNRLESPE